MSRRFHLVALVAVLLTPSCGSDTTGPPPETLIGAWNATSVALVSMADPTVRIDLVTDLGAAVTLELEPDNDFTLTLAYTGPEPGGPWGMSAVVTGTWTATDVLTLQTSPTSQWQFEIDLEGDTLRLTEADTSFDFDEDGTPEDADLSLDLIRVQERTLKSWEAGDIDPFGCPFVDPSPWISANEHQTTCGPGCQPEGVNGSFVGQERQLAPCLDSPDHAMTRAHGETRASPCGARSLDAAAGALERTRVQ